MTAPHEPTPSSQSPSPSPSEAPARDYTWEPLPHLTEESLRQGITVLRRVPHIAPTRPAKYVRVRYTLKQTSSPMQHGTEFRYPAQSFTPQIPLAILALVSSLTREYQPWFSCESIEMIPDYDS